MPDSQKNLGEHPTAAVSHVTLFVKGFIVRQQLQVVRGTQQCIILHVDIFPSEVEHFSHHTAHTEFFSLRGGKLQLCGCFEQSLHISDI